MLPERPEQEVGVAAEPRGLDRSGGDLARLAQPAEHLEREHGGEHERDHEPLLSRAAADLERLAAVGDGRLVALEERLGPGEIPERLEPARELLGGERLDPRERRVELRLGLGDHAGGGAREREQRAGRGGEARVRSLLGGGQRLCREGPAERQVEAVEGVEGELDAQPGGLRRREIVEPAHLRPQAPSRLVVLAQPVLRARAGGDEPATCRRIVLRDPVERLDQRVARLVEGPGRGSRGSELLEQAEPPFVVRREDSQRGAEPAGRRGRSTLDGRAPGLHQRGDRVLVARLGAELQVVGAQRRPRAASLERGRHPRMRPEPPAAPRARVHGAAHERMAEGEAARVAQAHEVGRQQLVQRGQRVPDRHLPRRCGELGIERLPRHGGALEHEPGGGTQRLQLTRERVRDRLRYPHRHVVRGAGGRWEAGRAQQLLEVERIAAAVADQDLARGAGHPGADQRLRFGRRERREVDPLQHAAPLRGLDRLGERRLRMAVREREQHGSSGRAAQQRPEHLERRRVAPLHVVEQQRERTLRREPLEQSDDGAVRPVALRREPRSGLGQPGERREHRGELARALLADRAHQARLDLAEMAVQGVDQQRVRQVALELGRAAGQRQHPAPRGARAELAEQA